MDRRSFFRVGAGALLVDWELVGQPRRAPDLVRRALSSPIAGFPTIQPIFGGIFVPGGNATQMISANGFDALSAQVQSLAPQGMRLTSFTAIRNMNSTWYYAAFAPGTGAYQLLRTVDPNMFQQTFAANQNGYRLVDFTTTWEPNQPYYTGYWVAVTSPVKQALALDLPFLQLNAQWTTLTLEGLIMTRVQAVPQQDVSGWSGLFEAGTGGNTVDAIPIDDFPNYVTQVLSGKTLLGLAYDAAGGYVAGCWGNQVASAQFVWNLDWNTLQATAQQMAAQGLILHAVTAYPNAPDFDTFFAANLAPYVMGYAYAVSRNGQVVSNGYGFSRSGSQPQNPNQPYTPTTRSNLASISKAVSGIALEAMLLQYPSITLDTPFWQLIANMVPNPNSAAKKVTLRNLATMKSGFLTPPNEGPFYGSLWPYLNTYLAQPLVGTPGVTYSYNNENFTVLQGVIDQVTGMDYVTYVNQNVLQPAGVDLSIFNPVPDPGATATLSYSGPNDTLTGTYWSQIDFVAPAGWVSSAVELLKVLMALRGTSVVPAGSISEMFNDGIGWFPFAGVWGSYFQKDGMFYNGAAIPQTLNTCVVRLGEGYDIALVANTQPPIDVVGISANAFDSRGLLTSDSPPAIATVIGAASYLPKAAPGAYCSILGSGFTDQAATDWTSSIYNSKLPIAVDGISVNVNGQPAYVQYVSATQVNFLPPGNSAAGIATVDLITPTGVMSSTVEIDAVAPGLFCYALKGVLYPSSVYATGSGVVYVAAVGALAGYTSRPAAAGDMIELYATGCGPTSPAAPDGVVFTGDYPAASLAAFQVLIGGKNAAVSFAGLVGPGLWQINVQVPSGLVGGNQALVLSVGGVASQANVMITLLGG